MLSFYDIKSKRDILKSNFWSKFKLKITCKILKFIKLKTHFKTNIYNNKVCS